MLSLWCPLETVQDFPRLLQTCPKLPLGPVTQGNVLLQSICDTFHRYCLGPSGPLSECAVASVSFNASLCRSVLELFRIEGKLHV